MIANLTWGADFAGLVNYLVENRDHEVIDLHGVSTIALAADEMAAVASLNDRATNKLLHVSVSAAHEDGLLTSDRWLYVADRLEATLGLRGHLRVIVRHRDKTHDHIHIFWCLISLETGQTPPKQWFLRKGCAVQGIGPHALTEAEIAEIPTTNRARRTYDFRALARCQDTCRQLERQLELRRLKTPTEAAEARMAGDKVINVSAQRKRAERVGSTPLTDRADEIRAALDTPDWPSKWQAIAAIGLEFQPTFRATRKGTELRGLVIYEAADPGNRIKASQLDTPTRKYGCRRLEERHDEGALSFQAWWPVRESAIPAPSRRIKTERLKEGFNLLRERHHFMEQEKKERRNALRKRQARDRARIQRTLMERRRAEALRLPSGQRRSFYQLFSSTIRAPELASLARAHKDEAAALARARAPDWTEYLAMCAANGDQEAAAVLQSAQPRKPEVPSRVPTEMSQDINQPRHLEPLTGERYQSLPAPIQDLTPEDMLRAYREFQARGR